MVGYAFAAQYRSRVTRVAAAAGDGAQVVAALHLYLSAIVG
jgi:TPP-dependent pyruvate/acetoin dehydrogenase alpha subunit